MSGPDGTAARAHALLRGLLDGVDEPVTVFAPVLDQAGSLVDLEFVEANQAACSYNGMPRDELLGRRLLDLFPAMADSPSMLAWQRILATGQAEELRSLPYRSERHGGRERIYDVHMGRAGGRLYSAWVDVTDRVRELRRAENAIRALEAAERLAGLGSWVWDLDTRRITCSDEYCRILGLANQDSLPNVDVLAQCIHPEDRARVIALLHTAREDREPFSTDHRIVRPDGQVRWLRAQAAFVPGAHGAPDQVLGIVLDITDQRQHEQEIERVAVTDPLTGVWNRRHAQQALADSVAEARRYGPPLAVLLVDIDRFKAINDTHGHAVGDLVLTELCQRLASNLRPSDVLARWGGEEFIIVARHCDLGAGIALAEKVRTIIARAPFDAAGTVTASIGVTEYRHDDSLDSLLARADQALYDAKAANRNTVRFRK